jgi:hypothetical protein
MLATNSIDVHFQIAIQYSAGRPQVSYRHLPGPYQGEHDHTAWPMPDTQLVIHLYWCPALPHDEVRQPLLTRIEQFVRRTLQDRGLLKSLEDSTKSAQPNFLEIYNSSTRTGYVYVNGKWVPEAIRRKPRPITLSNWP